jgi:hypothetical protein
MVTLQTSVIFAKITSALFTDAVVHCKICFGVHQSLLMHVQKLFHNVIVHCPVRNKL